MPAPALQYNDRLCCKSAAEPHPEPWHSNRDNKSTAGVNVCTNKIISLYCCEKAQVKHVRRASRASKDLFFFCLLLRKETGGGDVYRCVITQHVCAALTNLIRDWAAKTPAAHSTSWCDRPIITQDYPELPSLCFFPLSFPAMTSETAANSAGRQGKNKPTVGDTVNEKQPVKESYR